MDRKLYLKNGYLNVPYILHYNVPFIFVVGGRGTGKTYGALKYVLESGTPFIYMRRTQSQADIMLRMSRLLSMMSFSRKNTKGH